MATRWVPELGTPVDNKEAIGRRLFDELELVGATDQKRPDWMLDVRHFLERRGEVSLDRLGRSGCDGRVIGFLRPRAEAAGRAFRKPKRFDGWATLQAKTLASPPKSTAPYPVTPSPLHPKEPDHPEHNPYHAHVNGSADSYNRAVMLAHFFQQHGHVVPSGCDFSQFGLWLLQVKAAVRRALRSI